MKKQTIIYVILLAMLTACANRGVGPQGGPQDVTPPELVSELPLNGSVNVKSENPKKPQTIEITFNEYVQLDNVVENVLISPPQQRPPVVSAIGKKVRVEFDSTLLDSTTYAIHFGAAICDYTEKNPLLDYTFSFSTGPVIDTMMIGGLMLNAEDLNPISGIIVGVHQAQNDTGFTTHPFKNIGKTDKEGYFTISNMKHGGYKLFGLNDVSRDYIYQPGEGIALYDSIIVPHCYREVVTDSIWHDSIAENWVEGAWVRDTIPVFDSVITQEVTIFEPHDILLMYFNEDKQRHYFTRVVREKAHFFTLYFAAPQDSLPIIRPISPIADSTTVDSTFVDWLPYTMAQHNLTNDTITIWLTDSIAIKQDTLAFEMTYLKSDSIYQLQPQTDTIRAMYRAPKINTKAKKDTTKHQTFVEYKTNGKSKFEIYDSFKVYFTTPVKQIEIDSLYFSQKVDSLEKPLPFTFLPADSSYMVYQITYPWEAEKTYNFAADSAAFRDIYGNVNNKMKASLTIRSLEEYSTLRVQIEPFDSTAIIQVLDEKDKPIRAMRATQEGALFQHLPPKSFYLRLFLDRNGDGKWTTGDLLTKRQPEPVYYFPSKLTLRANWDFEETIRYLDTPVEEQKPEELIKDANSKKK